MRDKRWKPRSRTEREYEAALEALGDKLAKATRKMATLEEIVAELVAVTIQPWFQKFAHMAARRMVKSVLVENAQTWREAARKGQQSRIIFQMLRDEVNKKEQFADIIKQNAELIKTIPNDLARHITRKAAREAVAGRRLNDIIREIQEQAPDLARWKATRIARTEVAKAHATITEIRAKEVGVDWYIWRTSKDQRVRSSHEHMEGVICQFSDPPSPERLAGEKSQGNYGPGQIYNCRCYAAPIIDVDFETFPAKVHTGGRIERLSKKRFMELV